MTAVAPDVKVQALRGYLWATVGVLLSPPGVDDPKGGVSRASGVEEVDQGVAPSGVVVGPLLATAVVEVLVGALDEALPHRCGSFAAPSGTTCRGAAAWRYAA